MSGTDSFVAQGTAGDDFVYLAAFQQLVLERVHDLVTVMDPVGTIVYASPSWNTLLGLDPDAIVGTHFLDVVHPAEHETFAAALGEVRTGRSIEAVTTRLRTNDGRWISVENTGAPLHDPQGAVQPPPVVLHHPEPEELVAQVVAVGRALADQQQQARP